MHLLRKLTFSRKPHLGCRLSLMGLRPLFMSLIPSIIYLFMDVMVLWSLWSGKWNSWLKFISSFWLFFGSTQLALLNVECFLVGNIYGHLIFWFHTFFWLFFNDKLIDWRGWLFMDWYSWFCFMAFWFITLFNYDMIYVHALLNLPFFVSSPIFLRNFWAKDSDAVTKFSLFLKAFYLGPLPLMKIEQIQTWHWGIKSRTRR